jgi:hypothetical protein
LEPSKKWIRLGNKGMEAEGQRQMMNRWEDCQWRKNQKRRPEPERRKKNETENRSRPQASGRLPFQEIV